LPAKPENVTCEKCGGPALRITVRRYFVRDEDGNVKTIKDALIIKCRICDEYPSTGEEKKRWEVEKAKQEVKEIDPDEPCCHECGKPRFMTGQFFTYGYGEDQKGYCRECNDSLGLST